MTRSRASFFFFVRFIMNDQAIPNGFAVILSRDSGICKRDIAQIEARTGLPAVFLAPISGTGLGLSRKYARLFGRELIRPSGIRQLDNVLSSCAFSVSDSAEDALISILAGKPSYIDASDAECRLLLARLALCGCPRGLATAYTKNRTSHIKEVGARGSDFKGISNVIAERIISCHYPS